MRARQEPILARAHSPYYVIFIRNTGCVLQNWGIILMFDTEYLRKSLESPLVEEDNLVL